MTGRADVRGMSRLAACYFCGTALDAPVESYPVVPAALAPTEAEQRTVTLCDGCREKLGTVVEHVVAAAESEAADEGVGLSAAGAPADGSETGVSVDPEPTTETAGGTESREDSEETPERLADDDSVEAGPGDAEESNEGEAEAEADDEGGDAQPTGAAAAGVTPAAYNRVVKLLQNREFPVDIEEMRTLATNAYDLDPGEFDAIVEALAEREPVRRDGGQLHRAE